MTPTSADQSGERPQEREPLYVVLPLDLVHDLRQYAEALSVIEAWSENGAGARSLRRLHASIDNAAVRYWGSDCVLDGGCGGNMTPESMTCDTCGSDQHTVVAFAALLRAPEPARNGGPT